MTGITLMDVRVDLREHPLLSDVVSAMCGPQASTRSMRDGLEIPQEPNSRRTGPMTPELRTGASAE